ncbi:hypothetical protein DM02DRAFT_700085 [Periconia macrospinosa]|uniref:Alpha/beta-hydrolase n=1 Tax=Periconia macrospinosa TaxID=97972 RepID=A0A2V1D579_9PLEO|nr:hypothetical protein DM02DRAFT_700085 [Periconia macrospinosa]
MPYAWETAFLEEGDMLKASEEQEHLYDDFHCFDFSPFHDGIKLDFHTSFHKSFCDGKKETSVLVLLMTGGGQGTQEPRYPPWRNCWFREFLTSHTIIVAPRVPLLPESPGRVVKQYMRAVLRYLGTETASFKSEITSRYPTMVSEIRTDHVFVIGESAGAIPANYAWHLSRGTGVKVYEMLFLYPLVNDYMRLKWDDFMGRRYEKDQVQKYTVEILVERYTSPVQLSRVGSVPPRGMGAAFGLSTTLCPMIINGISQVRSTWRLIFMGWSVLQEMQAMADEDYSLTGACESPGPDENILSPRTIVRGVGERLIEMWEKEKLDEELGKLDSGMLAEKVGAAHVRKFGPRFIPEMDVFEITLDPPTKEKPDYCPKIRTLHGLRDIHVPHENTEKFQRLIRKLYPEPDIHCIYAENKAHAFAYNDRGPEIIEMIAMLRGDCESLRACQSSSST